MRWSPHLLQIWLLAHIRSFCSSHSFSYIIDDRSLIACLLPVFRPPKHSFSEWRQFLEELTPTQFLWVARWNPDGPMIMGCPGIVGLPLLSHLGSTLVFPSRVIRQHSGLQDILTEADCLAYRFLWAASSSSVADRFLRVREIRRLWDTHFSVPIHWPRTAPIPRVPLAVASEVESSAQRAMHMELQSIKEERDRLRCELVDTRAELADYRELQRELAQTRARVANQDREIAHLSATLDQARAKAGKVSTLRFISRQRLLPRSV
ncbi:hypothetical protein CRG98_007601 [Punica granatum]|uniref:Aminotransferase-like plant mobile domain-containing protein n=1 Tax=Punica granatum TaxID=22663 RepID=A0A2I0KU31_PUNGR|nr:hypothetical protein CRG98_007601 [Punica granatum]